MANISGDARIQYYVPVDPGVMSGAASAVGAQMPLAVAGQVANLQAAASKPSGNGDKPELRLPSSGQAGRGVPTSVIKKIEDLIATLMVLMVEMKKADSKQTFNSSSRETSLAHSMAEKTRAIGSIALSGGVSKAVLGVGMAALGAGLSLKGFGKQLESTRTNQVASRRMDAHLRTTGAGAHPEVRSELNASLSKQVHAHEVSMIKGSRLQVHGSAAHQVGNVSGAFIEGGQGNATSMENAAKEIDAGDAGVQGKTTEMAIKQRSQRDETIASLQSVLNTIAQNQIDVMPVIAQNTRV
ncbi:hypothetical protein ACOTFF_13895 [Achromobacter xylosoxidans]